MPQITSMRRPTSQRQLDLERLTQMTLTDRNHMKMLSVCSTELKKLKIRLRNLETLFQDTADLTAVSRLTTFSA